MTQLEPENYEGDVSLLYDEINSLVSSEITQFDELMNLNTLKEIESRWLVDNDVEKHNIKWALVLHKFENVLSVYYDELEKNKINSDTVTVFIKLFAKFFSKCDLSLMYHPGLNALTKVFNSNFNCFIRLGHYFAKDLVVVRVNELVKRYISTSHVELNYLIVKSVDYLFKYDQFEIILELYKDYKISTFFEWIDKYLLSKDSILLFYSQLANSLLNSRQYTDSINLYKIVFNLPIERAPKEMLTQLVFLYNVNLILLPTDHIFYTSNYNNRPLDSNLVRYSSLFASSWIFQLVQSYHVYDYFSVERIINTQIRNQLPDNQEQHNINTEQGHQSRQQSTDSRSEVTSSDVALNLNPIIYEDILTSLRFKKLFKSIQNFSTVSLSKLCTYDPLPGATKKDTLQFLEHCFDPKKFYLAKQFAENWEILPDNSDGEVYLIQKENRCDPGLKESRSTLLSMNERLVNDNKKLDEMTDYLDRILESNRR